MSDERRLATTLHLHNNHDNERNLSAIPKDNCKKENKQTYRKTNKKKEQEKKS